MNTIPRTKVSYEPNELRPDILALNAYFTCFIDYEHSGKDFNLSTVHKNDELALTYFGGCVGPAVAIAGGQTKNLYRLVEFITDNNLWPTISYVRSRKSFYRRKLVSDKGFSDVIAAVQEAKDPALNECIRTYRFLFFSVAYTAVGEVGHEKLMKMQPGTAGRLAYAKVKKISKAAVIGKFKRLSIIAIILGGIFVFYKVLASGYLLTI